MATLRSKIFFPFWIALILFSATGIVASHHMCDCTQMSCAVASHACHCQHDHGAPASCSDCGQHTVIIKPVLEVVAVGSYAFFFDAPLVSEMNSMDLLFLDEQEGIQPTLCERCPIPETSPPLYIRFQSQRLDDAGDPADILS